MTAYRLTNRMPMTVVLEDMGVTLQRAGGTDSSVVVPAALYLGSSDAKKHASWFRVESIQEPSSAPPPVHAVHPPPRLDTDTSPAPAPPVFPAPSPSPAIESLHATVRELDAKMAQFISIMANAQNQQVVYLPSDESPRGGHRPRSSVREEDPVFIPGSILPKGAESHISVQEGDSSDEGFDDSAEALRKLRRKKK